MSDQGPETSSGTCWECGQRPYHLGLVVMLQSMDSFTAKGEAIERV